MACSSASTTYSSYKLNPSSIHKCSLPLKPPNFVAFQRFSSPSIKRWNKNRLSIKSSASVQAPPTSGGLSPAISLTNDALKHLTKMRSERNGDLCLRIGVKQGGCSGMSYTMEFEKRENARPDDCFIEYDGFTIVCDPKSLLFVFGMQLDYSDALIGGGFSFKNPNATQTCGCGKSFAAEM